MSTALNHKQVAAMLSVNERTVYRMSQRGDLPAFTVGGTWKFLEQDIMGWVERQKHGAGAGRGSPGKGGRDAGR